MVDENSSKPFGVQGSAYETFRNEEEWLTHLDNCKKWRKDRHEFPLSDEEREFRQTHGEEIAEAREKCLQNCRDFDRLMPNYILRPQNAIDAETLAMKDVALATRWVEHFMRLKGRETTAEPVRQFLEKALDPETNALPESAGWQLRQLAREATDEAVKRER